MNFRTSSTLVLTALACAVVGHAQTSTTTGAIKGLVTSKKGGPVANATIILKSLDTGFTRNVTTNDRGEYHFSLLPLGSFELT
ncbi:MAG TPA: carboxypeptidase-like regulatory domain-containing protein, partial [Geothrix sp.]